MGNIANWKNRKIWEIHGIGSKFTMDKKEICSTTGSSEGILMIMPAEVNWYEARDLCRRFRGRLHIDKTEDSVIKRTIPLIARMREYRYERCKRIWLGASDVEEEGIWKDSETNEVLDISRFWGPAQPNGLRVQNCAGIHKLVFNDFQVYLYFMTSILLGWIWKFTL